MSKRYSESEKQNIVTVYKDGFTAKDVCNEYGISRSTLMLWAKQFSLDPEHGKTSREIYFLEMEVKRLRVIGEKKRVHAYGKTNI